MFFMESLRQDLVQKVITKILYKDLAKVSYGDLANKALLVRLYTIYFTTSAKSPAPGILYRDLARTPLTHRDTAQDSVAQILPRSLVQKFCQFSARDWLQICQEAPYRDLGRRWQGSHQKILPGDHCTEILPISWGHVAKRHFAKRHCMEICGRNLTKRSLT